MGIRLAQPNADCSVRRSARQRRPGRFLLLAASALVFIPCNGAFAQQRDIPDDVQDIVFLGPIEPVKIRVHVRTDGKGFRALRRLRLDRMFEDVDEDTSGAIEEAERAHLPTPQQLAAGQMVPTPQFAEFDTDPPDGKFSRAEFDRYVARMMGVLFHIQEPPSRSVDDIDLFGILDVDEDGRLVPEDAAALSHRLRQLDFDNDESYSTAEIGPFQDPFSGGRTRRRKINSGDTPFRVIPDEGSMEALADEIGTRYSRGGNRPVESGVDAAPPAHERFDAFVGWVDRNGDGTLQAAEIERWLLQAPPHVNFVAELPNPTTHRARLILRPADDVVVSGVDVKNTREVTFQMGNQVFEAGVLISRSAIADNRGLFKIRFLMADGDKNGYLDEAEFFVLQVPGATFGTVDRDGDGMLFVEEVVEYVDQEALASRSRAVMTVSREGQTLFEAFDTDRNGRLTPRELAEAAGVLASLDRNGDGVIDEGELVGRYRLRFELGKPAVFYEGADRMAAQNASGGAMNRRSTAGPDWFQRMDRNADADLSRREFLGTRAMFDRLDGDSDGLIDANEAAAAMAAAETTQGNAADVRGSQPAN